MRAPEPRERRVHAAWDPPDSTRFTTAISVDDDVAAASQGAYLQIPFTVPPGTTAIHIRYCYDSGSTLDMGVYEPLLRRHDARAGRAPRLERQRGQGPGDRRERLLAAGHLRVRPQGVHVPATRPAPISQARSRRGPGPPSSASPSSALPRSTTRSTSRRPPIRIGRTTPTRAPSTAAPSRTRARAGTRATSTRTASRSRATRSCRRASTMPSSPSPRAVPGSTGSASSTTTTTSSAARSASTSPHTRAS